MQLLQNERRVMILTEVEVVVSLMLFYSELQ